MRIGFFGGSFDPPHAGHVAVARAAADAFSLERVLLAPVGRQALKGDTLSAPYADRLAMVALLGAEDTRLAASPIDAPRDDGRPNYTVETLGRLRQEMAGATIFSIVGADTFLEMPRWREPDRLMELTEWIVVTRPGYVAGVGGRGVHLLEGLRVDVSATVVRERLREGLGCGGMVPEAVLTYIGERGLYRGGLLGERLG